MKMYTAFWVVWNPSANSPKVKHNNYTSAVLEAERLSKQYPNQEFIVLQAVCGRTYINTPPVKTLYVDVSKNHQGYEGIPINPSC